MPYTEGNCLDSDNGTSVTDSGTGSGDELILCSPIEAKDNKKEENREQSLPRQTVRFAQLYALMENLTLTPEKDAV